ncbi:MULTISPECIES: hypothetical protein [unclassified Microcoleus]
MILIRRSFASPEYEIVRDRFIGHCLLCFAIAIISIPGAPE